MTSPIAYLYRPENNTGVTTRSSLPRLSASEEREERRTAGKRERA
jgi:hypothetical protein